MIDTMAAPRRFRYSRKRFRQDLLVASVLTFAVCGLFWLISGIAGLANRDLLTAGTAAIFFGFLSFRSIRMYATGHVIMAVLPTGLYDDRLSHDTIAWGDIRDLAVFMREKEFVLRVVHWPQDTIPSNRNVVTSEVNLSMLEASPTTIISAIEMYKPVRQEM